MKKTPNNDRYWYMLLSFLLTIVIILVCVLIYYIRNTPHSVVEKTIPVKEVVYIDRNSDHIHKGTREAQKATIYPNELPRYNSQEYQQIGILTANETEYEPIILPLFAKKLHNNRDRWQYYTATDKNNMMRLPITHQNMDCEDSIGCKEIYDGDTIYVEIYKGRIFTATIYKTQAPQYFADSY